VVRTDGSTAVIQIPLLPPDPREDAGGRNVRLLSILRWLAVSGQLATILLVRLGFGVPLPLGPMILALAVLVVLNLAIAQVGARRAISDRALFVTFLADVACLTVQLYLSGGVANPFVTLYLLQVVIAAVLLPAWSSWALVGLTAALFAWLAWSPFRLPADVGAAMSPPFTIAAWFSFTLAAILLVLFVTRIMRNLARRDARLAALRQRAAEEEHVVRMGLLASGAAHELGTPLSSLAVMLGDWRREAVVQRSPSLLADVEEMAGQVARCKEILGQVLLAAGEVRGDHPVRTTLRAFLKDVVQAWRSTHDTMLVFEDHIGGDPPIVADRPLAQTIDSLLDNAREAGAEQIRLVATLHDATVTLLVRDDGSGFPVELLATFGQPYRSTKGSDGAGVGLFLATNVLRTLGGTIAAQNVDGGGAEVTIAWPLSALAMQG
jgi:two-component system, sensor histidine kinase RegB